MRKQVFGQFFSIAEKFRTLFNRVSFGNNGNINRFLGRSSFTNDFYRNFCRQCSANEFVVGRNAELNQLFPFVEIQSSFYNYFHCFQRVRELYGLFKAFVDQQSLGSRLPFEIQCAETLGVNKGVADAIQYLKAIFT